MVLNSLLDQVFVDIFQHDIGDPIGIKMNIVPRNNLCCDCLLGRYFCRIQE